MEVEQSIFDAWNKVLDDDSESQYLVAVYSANSTRRRKRFGM